MPTLTSSTGGGGGRPGWCRRCPWLSRARRTAVADLIVPGRRPGLGDAEMEGIVAALGREQLVGSDHHHRVVVLDRDLEVVEAVLLEQRRLPDRRLDEGLGVALPTSGEQPLVERAGVDADRMLVIRGVAAWATGDLVVELADVARVHPTAAQPASIAA